MVIGYFKNVLKINDKTGGNHVQEVKVRDLEEMMEEVGLYEHETKGEHYTWLNRHLNDTIYSRIERAIINR